MLMLFTKYTKVINNEGKTINIYLSLLNKNILGKITPTEIKEINKK